MAHDIRGHLGQHAAILANVLFIGLLVGSERTLVPLLAAEEFGISSSTVTLSFIAGFGAAKSVANLVAGRFADRTGRRRVLLLGWAFGIAVPFVLAGATNWTAVVLANVLLGVNQGLAWTATLVIMGDLAGDRRRGTAMGANEFLGYVAIGVAAWLTGWLGATAGLREAVLLMAGCSAVVGFTSAFEVRETLPTLRPPTDAVSRRRADPHDLACAFAGHLTKVVDAGIWGLVPLLLAHRGLPLPVIGLVAGTYPAVWGAGQLAAGAASDRIGRRDLIAAGMGLQAVGLVVLAGASAPVSAVAGAAVTGLGAALVYPTLLAAVCDAAEAHTSGAALGDYRFWRDLGFVVGALAGGAVADRVGIPASMAIVAVLAVLAAVLVRVHVREPAVERDTIPVPA